MSAILRRNLLLGYLRAGTALALGGGNETRGPTPGTSQDGFGRAGAWEDERKRRCCRSGRAGVGTGRVDPCEPLRSWASEYGVPAEVALWVFPLIDTVLPATGARSSRVQYEGRKRRSCSPS